jgi:hypothetical protein
MRDAAAAAGLRELIAPVRPTLKARYPLIPIERYVEWRRDDGSHFDPWIRLHERVGGTVIGPCPRSMVMQAPTADWEEWTGLEFPEDGEYVFRGALATLVVDRHPRGAERLAPPRAALGGQLDHSVSNLDEAVAGERLHRLRVELVERKWVGGDYSQRVGATLAEGAFEGRLLAQRLVTAAARGARRRERADLAARHPREADGRAEIEERLQRRRPERVPGPLLDSRDVRVDRKHALAESLIPDCGRGVGADPGQLGEVVRPAVLGDLTSSAVQVERAAVVAEPLPRADHVGN